MSIDVNEVAALLRIQELTAGQTNLKNIHDAAVTKLAQLNADHAPQPESEAEGDGEVEEEADADE